MRCTERKDPRGRTTQRNNQHTFCKELSNHLCAAGAKGQPHRKLPLPVGIARQQQHHHVAHGYQKHQADHRH